MAWRSPSRKPALRASWRPLLTAAALIGMAEAAKHAGLLPVFVRRHRKSS